MVGIGLGQLGVRLCREEGGYEFPQVHPPWSRWGVGPAVLPTIPPGLPYFFLPRWPAKEEVELGGWS